MEEVILAVQKVRDGKHYLHHDLASEMVSERTKTNKLEHLTPRELRTITLVAERKPYGEIAYELKISYQTVANICSQLKTKLGVRTRADLMRIAIQNLPDHRKLGL